MTPNAFKEALAERRMQIGIVAGMADAYCTDIVGGAPFDWVLIDDEHSPGDSRALLRQLQVLAAHGPNVAFRSGTVSPAEMTRWLDVGVRTIVVPMVESAEQAANVVAATRYPPAGRRGVGIALSRAAGWGRDAGYAAHADMGICVVAQIESPDGVAAAEAIAATDGIDGILIGPSDLAARLGHPGDAAHPDVRETIDAVVRQALACGKAAGMFVNNAAAARRYASLGCSFLVVGTDTGLFARALDEAAGAFRRALDPAAE